MPADVLIHDSADKTPPAPPGRHPLTMVSYADAPRSAGWRLPAQAWVIATVVCIAPVALLLWAAYGAVSELLLLFPWVAPLSGAVLVLVALAGLLMGLAGLAARGWVAIQHARVVRSRLGVPVDVVAQMRADPAALESAAMQLELATAPYRLHPNLSTLSAPAAPKAAEQAQLAPIDVSPVAAETWLAWVDAQPHVMIAGRTNAGKTTLATAILGERIRAGEQIIVCDPHWQPGKWHGVPAIGGGRAYAAILDALQSLLDEMDRRYQDYTQGREAFDRLTVLIDEVPGLVGYCEGARLGVWRSFARVFGSEARKVRMSAILLTQSPLVEDIDLNSRLRENFARVALGDQAPRLLRDEPDAKRRAHLLDLLRGQRHPAAMVYASEVHVLDTSEVPILAAERASGARVWLPPPAMPRVDRETATRKALAALKQRGVSRDDARRVYGLVFTNDVWGGV